MNKELQVLADWFRANKLSLNISKTKCVLFCRSPPPENEEFILGLYIDEKLDWHEHIKIQKIINQCFIL